MFAFTQLTCPNEGCHVLFALPDEVVSRLRDSHETFYCPYGHSQVFRAENETEKLRRERDRLKQAIAQRDDEIREKDKRIAMRDRSLAARKGQLTKIKNRVAHGVCPCCTRSFTNLRQHMASKHPDYKKEVA